MLMSDYDSRESRRSGAAEFRVSLRATHSGRRIATSLIPILTLILAGCGTSEAPGSDRETGSSEEAATVDDASAALVDLSPEESGPGGDTAEIWDGTVTNVGAGLVLRAAGAEVLRMACIRESGEMTIDVPAFRSIGSEERLSFGFGDDSWVFVAEVTPPPPSGVHAARPIDDDFLEAFSAAQEISAVYGSQRTGPHVPPDSAPLDLFVSACRQAMAG